MGVIREVLRVPDVRRIELGWGLLVVGKLAGNVALVVYAYEEGGATLVAAYVVAREVAAIGVGMFVATVGDRVRRDRLLRWFTGVTTALLALAALVVVLSGPPAAVVAVAAVSSAFAGVYRPLQAAILPWLVRTPAELTATNVTAAVMESAGALVGPVLAGTLVAIADAQTAIGVAAGFLCLAMLALRGLRVPGRPTAAGAGHAHVVREIAEGMSAFVRLAPPGGVAILVLAQTLVRGAITVLIAVLAVDVLALGDAAIGWLTAALGIGGLIGGAAAASVVRATRLGRTFVAGLLLWGVPLAGLALFPTPAVAYIALVLVGVGNAFEDVGAFTLIARLASPRVLGRVLAATELLALLGIGLGSLITPLLIATIGVPGTLALLGGGLAALALAHLRRFTRLDRAMPEPGPELELVRGLPMFRHLSLAVTELVASEFRPRRFDSGTVVLREGDWGDDFHIILSGAAAVSVRGTPRPPLARGDCFGEIALLRDVPRTATITATDPLHTLALGRTEFLTAISGNALSIAAADAVITERLAADPLDGTDRPDSG
ncbi:cyclic nucleotide-binding domain-containing protein [Kribbella sp. NBC_01510]|uniref:cyclic nucleotide-binding domain-containing protein n=1 Tax=Kribbella sp. NBC_01510 TaxID=2903581 RepID=UPI00386B4981